MKIIVQFSGGKDSLASLIWAINEFGKDNVEAVFCDTKWEHELTYKHIDEIIAQSGVKFTRLTSKKYNGFVDLAVKKKRFPSTKTRFCTEELKSKPMIDYVLDSLKDDLLIIQGIRKDESRSRSKMDKQCSFFKYYFKPYGYDKSGKPKYHTYRKKDIIEWKKKYADDILRPVFGWAAQEVINYILKNGYKPNPLYYLGFSRVGCLPCIMARKQEVKSMIENLPDAVERLKGAEKTANSGFFPPDYIPKRFCTGLNEKSGKRYPKVEDVIAYVDRHKDQLDLFEDKNTEHRCMSFYGLCE